MNSVLPFSLMWKLCAMSSDVFLFLTIVSCLIIRPHLRKQEFTQLKRLPDEYFWLVDFKYPNNLFGSVFQDWHKISWFVVTKINKITIVCYIQVFYFGLTFNYTVSNKSAGHNNVCLPQGFSQRVVQVSTAVLKKLKIYAFCGNESFPCHFTLCYLLGKRFWTVTWFSEIPGTLEEEEKWWSCWGYKSPQWAVGCTGINCV